MLGLVVASQAMNPALNENKPKLGIPILSVPLQVLANSHCLLDQMVEVLGQVWCQTRALEDSQDLVTGDPAHLGHAVRISQDHTNL